MGRFSHFSGRGSPRKLSESPGKAHTEDDRRGGTYIIAKKHHAKKKVYPVESKDSYGNLSVASFRSREEDNAGCYTKKVH